MTLSKRLQNTLILAWGLIVGLYAEGRTHNSPNLPNDNTVTFPVPVNDHFEEWLAIDHVFSPDECGKILALGLSATLDGATTDIDQKAVETRNSRVAWLYSNPSSAWIFQRLGDLVRKINAANWNFDITGFHEAMQFTAYEGPGSHYSWHMDSGNKQFSKRKISVICQLSDPRDYGGGDLEFFKNPPQQAPKKQGTCVLFPSFMTHRVVPITHGHRYSLVVWTSGPSFR